MWIKLHDTYPDDPKVLKLQDTLGVATADAFPVRLWLWCARQCQDGKPSEGLIERACGWKGKKGRLIAALKECGFLDHDCSVHNWMQRSGSDLSRMNDAKRHARERQAKSRTSRDSHTKVTRDTLVTESEQQRDSRARAEKETKKEIEKETPTPLPSVPSPAAPPPAASPPGRVVGPVGNPPDPAPARRKRVGIRTKASFGLHVHAFVKQFREDFHDNVQADFEFRDPVPQSELVAAEGLLRDATREVLDVEKAWVMNDKRAAADANAFPGWALVIRSVANWRDKREKIRNAMRADGVL